MELKELAEQINKAVEGKASQQELDTLKTGVANADKELKSAKEQAETAVKEAKAATVKADESDKKATQIEKEMNEYKAAQRLKEKTGPGAERKSFNDVLAETIAENSEKLATEAKSSGSSFKLQMKAAGDMSYGSNFAGASATNLTTEYRQAPLALPKNEVWMRNVIPGGQTNAASIWYPRHVGGEGSPAPWAAGTRKPIFDYDFDAINTPVQWIAGIVRVPRQMLDDIQFLTSFLQVNMLKDLYRVENAQILNGNGTSPNLQGIIPVAEAYDGTLTIPVERIIDAAFGQIAENYHQASAVVLHPRDAVGIALNKASGSGEYDLPYGNVNNSVGYVNGRLTIGGLDVVTTTDITKGTFLTGDMTAAQFITRLAPEIRFFEQNVDDVEKNMITVRIEERAALAIYYTDAFVKGNLAAA